MRAAAGRRALGLPGRPGLSFEMTVRYRSARYEILVENSGGVGRGIASAQLDDTVIVERPLRVPLADDGNTHRLRVRLG